MHIIGFEEAQQVQNGIFVRDVFTRDTKLKSKYKPISAHCCISYRNQSFDLQSKPNNWFLYEMQN